MSAKNWREAAGIDKLIGFCGRSGSGKSLAAAMATKHFPYYRYSFAKPLKDTVAELFLIHREFLDDPVKKQLDDPRWGMKHRKILQLFGTEAMRHVFGDDFWLKQAEMRLTNVATRGAICGKLCVVIDDVRFPNEIEWVKASGGSVIYLERLQEAPVPADHASEQIVLPDQMGRNEYYIYNDGTPEFHERVISTVRAITYYPPA